MTQNYLKRKFSSHKQGEIQVEFVSTAEEHYLRFFILAEILRTLKLHRQWKYYSGVLKALHEKDFDHER